MSDIRDRIRADVAARRPVDARERQAIADFLRLYDGLSEPFSETADRVHVTGSAIVVTTDRRRVLLHKHKRLGLWLQPGGHIDAGELPWEGSLREAREETGLPASLVLGADPLPTLVHVDVHPGPRKHTHLDLRYLVEAPHVDPAPPEGESQEVEWFHWYQAMPLTESGLEGALRALQPGTPRLRTVRSDDAVECAHVYLRSRAFGLPEVPFAFPPSDVKRWMADEVVGRTDMWVAEVDGVLAGLMVLGHERDGSWIEHLYLDPAWVGRGLGDRFIDIAKQRGPEGLQLWTFQSNDRARRFYERHGFVAETFTDGAGNAERTPDVRYRWTPTTP
ncbi:MAG: GNAT family N-acetyltransferase [Actinobacteria bacterium]|nr:GNAT family N-acetyltransferase [Actinomycetota bacterium]